MSLVRSRRIQQEKTSSKMPRYLIILVIVALPFQLRASDSQATKVSFTQSNNGLQIFVGDQMVAEYVFKDEQILRPYFRHIRTLTGQQVTRNCPPKAEDLNDHATMHPGLWLAFGDLNGADFWRNKGKVKHDGFIKGPQEGRGLGSFTVRNSYEVSTDKPIICTEDCTITVSVRPNGYLLDWTSTFRSQESDFSFGDQEEMGLGVRLATPLAVVKGGEITDSQGRKNGKQVWGQQSDWCEYSGATDGTQLGVVLMPDPANFRSCWFHARDYGLLVANPFGRNAFTKGEKSKVVVPKGEAFRLRFGVLVYGVAANEQPQLVESAYNDFIQSKSVQP